MREGLNDMMQRAMDMLMKAAAALDEAAASGHLKTALMLAIAAVLALLLCGWAVMAMISRRLENAGYEPVVQHARRVAMFYLDRPLPAEIILEYPDLKSRFRTGRQRYPACRAQDLEQAVWEAEYNEFVAWELENEIRDVKQKFAKSGRRAMRLAMRELSDARRGLPRGIRTVIKTRFWPTSTRRSTLEYAHAWLDAVLADHDRTRMPSGEKYRALRANKFKCAWCGSDWNDGAVLDIVKTRSGALMPACRKCADEHGKQTE